MRAGIAPTLPCSGLTRAPTGRLPHAGASRSPRIDAVGGPVKPGQGSLGRWGLSLAAALFALAGCKIVEHADETAAADGAAQTASTGAADAQRFDPARYVEERWAAEILPYAAENASALPDVLAALTADRNAAGVRYGHREGDEGKPWSYLVVARGTVLAVDRSSRAGAMPIDLAPEDGTADAVAQVGPVIRGTALRDALPFLSFADVVNQMEWAAVSRQMHDRLNATLLVPAEIDALVGRPVEIRGAFTDPGAGGEIAITPLTITPLD
jgi:predicted lipoprotein